MKEDVEWIQHLAELCRQSIELLKDTTGLTEDNDESIDIVIDNLREVAQGLKEHSEELEKR
jgi:ABC-type transporter Mla subunit MlaD